MLILPILFHCQPLSGAKDKLGKHNSSSSGSLLLLLMRVKKITHNCISSWIFKRTNWSFKKATKRRDWRERVSLFIRSSSSSGRNTRWLERSWRCAFVSSDIRSRHEFWCLLRFVTVGSEVSTKAHGYSETCLKWLHLASWSYVAY